GGTVDASVRYRPGDGWSGDAELVGGAWHPPDVPAVAALRDVEATADLEGGLLRVDASGRADAGTVLANADVDLTLRRVAAEVRASGRLEDVLPAAVRDAPAAARPSGTTFVALSVRGWRDLRLDADARLQGTWDERPATLRADGVTFRPADGWTGTLDGRLLGGDVALALEGRGVPRIRATLAGARAAGATLTGDADLRSVAPLDAAWSLDVAGVPGGPLDATTASLRGRHDPDGATLEADVDAEALRGTGAWRLARDGVEGGATLRLAGADAAGGDGRIELRTDGPWEALGVAVRTAADAPWRPAWRGVQADADVRGVVRADLRGATLHALDGAWGPLRPARIGGGVRLALAPTPLRVGGTPVGR
ncbi:MAG: hypothetical protein RI554_11665, partial [Trueperaceae bacterium]|nr:hypothetical protein [Trueperaceae bacterium]